MPLAAYDSDVRALSVVLRGVGASGFESASTRMSPVASAATAQGVPVTPRAGGSASPSVATYSRVSSVSITLYAVLRGAGAAVFVSA